MSISNYFEENINLLPIEGSSFLFTMTIEKYTTLQYDMFIDFIDEIIFNIQLEKKNKNKINDLID